MDEDLKAILTRCLDDLHAEGYGESEQANDIAAMLPIGTQGLYFTIDAPRPPTSTMEANNG